MAKIIKKDTGYIRKRHPRHYKITAVCLFIVSIWFFYLFLPASNAAIVHSITIKKGSNLKHISQQLKSEHLIKSSTVFRLFVLINGKSKKLRAGTFALSPSYSLSRILNILQEKEGPASLVKITIPEGYTLKELAVLVEESQLYTKEAFLEYTTQHVYHNFKEKYTFLSELPTQNIEGYLFPDTYILADGIDIESFIDILLSSFEKRVLPLWTAYSSQKYSLHEFLTLASIIEKEAYVKSEQKIISSVFHNRLKKRKYLESCPTILYAIGDPNKTTLLYEDLDYPSRYNTYRRPGLPPTPICSPGIDAFKAALYPDKTSYLFFVAKGDGSHVFSKSYEDHVKRQFRIQRKSS